MSTTHSTIKVIVVDDHAILRSGLRLLINAQPDTRVVAEAASVAELSHILSNMPADVVLLDIGLPGTTGLQALRQIRQKFPAVKILILTMHREVALIRSALASGASGFLSKQAADGELLSAIRAVNKGGLYLDPSLTKELLLVSAEPFVPGAVKLSERERQVLKLVAQGYSNQDIASSIHVSVKTVETYRSRISDKLGLRTRTEIMRYAIVTGLLTTEDFLDDKSVA